MAGMKTAAALAVLLLAGACGSHLPRIAGRMDREDEQRAEKVLDSSRTGETVAWRNGDNGRQYAVTPERTYSRATGGVCRDFTTTTIVDGKQEVVHATACRQPDGTWKAS